MHFLRLARFQSVSEEPPHEPQCRMYHDNMSSGGAPLPERAPFYAEQAGEVGLFEPATTVNTGNASEDARTRGVLEKI